MADFITADHPCLRHTKVPIWTRPPMTAAEFTDPSTPISEYAMGLIKYIYDLADRAEEADDASRH